MSAVIQRDGNGVVLRYADGSSFVARRDMRIVVLRAEVQLRSLKIILDHLDVSDIGRDRIERAIEAICEALEIKRKDLGMPMASERGT